MKLLAAACVLPLLGVLGTLPHAVRAAGPTVLTLQASGGSGGADITAFVDGVEIIDAVTGLSVRGSVPNASFEGPVLPGFGYTPTGGRWAFAGMAGIARNGSAFDSPAAPDGAQVAFLQSRGSGSSTVEQQLPELRPGQYQVRLRVAQRACCTGTFDQGVRVWVNGVLLGTVVPDRDGQFHTYTSSSFVVAPPRRTRS